MLFPWRLDLGYIVNPDSAQQKMLKAEMIRCERFPIEVEFRDSTNTAVQLSGTPSVQAVLKDRNIFDGDSLIPECDLAWNATTSRYEGAANFVTSELDDRFNVNVSTGDDVSPLKLDLGFGYRLSALGLWTPSNTIPITLYNNTFRGDEATPATVPDAEADWLPRAVHSAVASVAGSPADALDMMVTVDRITTLDIAFVVVSGVLSSWQLIAGTNASDGVDYQRPVDYHASTNARVWRRAL
jgi:hypothetical protein